MTWILFNDHEIIMSIGKRISNSAANQRQKEGIPVS